MARCLINLWLAGIGHHAAHLSADRRGGAAVMAGLGLPVLLALSGVALDYATWFRQRQALQKAADSAAIVTTQELTVSSAADQARINAVARSIVNRSLGLGAADLSVTITAQPNANRNGVNVHLSQKPEAGAFPILDALRRAEDISAASGAQRAGSGKICVLVLSTKGDPKKGTITTTGEKDVLKLENSAQLTGQDCGVFSNSTGAEGITSVNSAVLTASVICSSGGFRTDGVESQRLVGTRRTGCVQITDPLNSRVPPEPGSCQNGGTILKISKSQDLYPGTWCGIEISGRDTVVTLRPRNDIDNVLFIKGGLLKVSGGSTLTGSGVGIVFHGAATFSFEGDSKIALQAPTTGPLAGILFFGSWDEDTTDAAGTGTFREFRITSDNARTLVGTIYLPRGVFTIDAKNNVADLSAYTAIVVNKLRLKDAPKLILNTNYHQTQVPVPEGVRNSMGTISLTQ